MLTNEINKALAEAGEVKAIRINPKLLNVLETERPDLVMDWYPGGGLTYNLVRLEIYESIDGWELVK